MPVKLELERKIIKRERMRCRAEFPDGRVVFWSSHITAKMSFYLVRKLW